MFSDLKIHLRPLNRGCVNEPIGNRLLNRLLKSKTKFCFDERQNVQLYIPALHF